MTTTSQSRFGALALPIAIVVAAFLLAGALGQLRRGAQELEVTGSAKRSVTADYAIWGAAVSAQQPSLAEANAELKRHAERVRAYLRESGVPDSAVEMRPFETEALREYQNGNETPRIAGYRLTLRLQVSSRDVAQVVRIASGTGSVIDAGVPLVSQPVQFLYTQLADARRDLLAAATEDAKARAEAIAGAVGSKVGQLRTVRVGVFQVTPRFSTEVSDYGVNDVSAREKDITSVVRATFEVR